MVSLGFGGNFFSSQFVAETILRQPYSLSSRKLSFQTLPIEIRLEIYSYFLLDQNVCFTTDSKALRLKYTTSIFRVCKQISRESLEFFYHGNIFFSFETNLNKEFQTVCQNAFPMILYEDPSEVMLPELACSITYSDKLHTPTQSSILASRNLPTLISLLNIEHTLPESPTGHIELTLEFPPTTYPPRSVDRITTHLSAIRQSPPRNRRSLALSFAGSPTPSTHTSIQSAFLRLALTTGDIIALSQTSHSRAQIFLSRGAYDAARGECTVRAIAIKRLLRAELNRGEMSEVKSLEVDMHLDLSLVEAAQSVHGLKAREA